MSFSCFYCLDCNTRLARGTEIPTRCDRCVAKREPRVARARARAAMLAAAYDDGYQGRPRLHTSGLYADWYRLGARRRASGRAPATFTLYGAQAPVDVAAPVATTRAA